jgi:hypothetical protein
VALANLPERMCGDLAYDVRTSLEALRAYGITGVYAIDLSNDCVSAVRVVTPELETTAVNGKIGPYARREFNPFAVRPRDRTTATESSRL